MRADAVCYRHPDRRASVSCQRCNRPICTECMVEAPIGFHCPDDAKGGRQKVYTAASLFRATGRPVVTLTLIAVNVAFFVIGLGLGEDPDIPGRDQLTVDFALFGPLVDTGEWYRLVTSGFLHANLVHIAFNMYLLYLLGQQLEPALGRIQFTVVYFFSLLTGSLGVLLLDPTAVTVGASGAVFGLMGAAVAVQRSRNINPFDTGLGALIVLNLVFTFAFSRSISVGGHIGGLVGGFVAGWLLVMLPARSRAMPSYLPTITVIALGGAVIGASLWAASNWMDPLF
jgi:membrane associated rhomboid family serine protease